MDPPLRSRFQSHLISLPDYQDFNKYLASSNPRVDEQLLKNLSDFGYSFYTNESNTMSLPDFPVENLDKLAKIMNSVYRLDNNTMRTWHPYSDTFLDTSKLINKLYPFSLLLKDEETNHRFCEELLTKFNLPTPKISLAGNEIDYQFVSVGESKESSDLKHLKFKSFHQSEKLLAVDLVKGTSGVAKKDPDFIMNDYHSGQLVDLMLSHASGHDFCIIGPQGKKQMFFSSY